MDEKVLTILACILSSTVATAIVTAVKDIIILKMKRKEAIEDRVDDRNTNLETLSKQIKSNQDEIKKLRKDFKDYVEDHEAISKGIIRSNKLILQSKLEHLCQKYIAAGKISHENRKMLHEMWDEYHFTWHGNGDLDLLMQAVDELPLLQYA